MADVIHAALFYLLAFLALVSALLVVTVQSLPRAGFLLVLCFACIGGLYFSLNADFVGAAQILVYVGAISILLLFGIMLTNRGDPELADISMFNMFLGAVAGLGFLGVMTYYITLATWPAAKAVVTDTMPVIGKAFLTEYLLPFEVASIILLMAMVGAIVLARKAAKTT